MQVTVSHIFKLRFLLEEKLSFGTSLTGKQLEQLQSHQSVRSRSYFNGLEQKQIYFADLGQFIKELTPEEESICRLRYLGIGSLKTYRRCVRAAEVNRVHFPEGTDELLTRQGEELVGRARSTDGKPIPDWLEVKGIRNRGLTYRQIADLLRLPYKKVRLSNHAAHEKVAWAIQQRKKELNRSLHQGNKNQRGTVI